MGVKMEVKGEVKSLESFDPLSDIGKYLGRDGFLYLAVFVDQACGAVLEKVVERRILLDHVLFRYRQQPTDGSEVE